MSGALGAAVRHVALSWSACQPRLHQPQLTLHTIFAGLHSTRDVDLPWFAILYHACLQHCPSCFRTARPRRFHRKTRVEQPFAHRCFQPAQTLNVYPLLPAIPGFCVLALLRMFPKKICLPPRPIIACPRLTLESNRLTITASPRAHEPPAHLRSCCRGVLGRRTPLSPIVNAAHVYPVLRTLLQCSLSFAPTPLSNAFTLPYACLTL